MNPAPMPPGALDERLALVASYIRADTHADIGSDHARLPIALLHSGRCQWVIVVEKTPGPLEVARAALAGAGLLARSDLRLGDGLAPLHPGETDSVSLSGLGAGTILGILGRATWLPRALALQPNHGAPQLRAWALAAGYHLHAEGLAPGFWRYPVLALRRAPGPDPAYQGLPRAAALRYGPRLLRAGSPHLRAELAAQRRRLTPLLAHARPEVLAEWQALEEAERVVGEGNVS